MGDSGDDPGSEPMGAAAEAASGEGVVEHALSPVDEAPEGAGGECVVRYALSPIGEEVQWRGSRVSEIGNHTPPMPRPEASLAPRSSGSG